jgi:hypothetical protein
MKRFLLFGGDHHYPSGGWHDFRGDFGRIEEATDFANELDKYGCRRWDWWHVIDTDTGDEVA